MHDRLYRAVYAAIALHFARKIISRVSPGPAVSRRTRPFAQLSPAEADRLRKELFSSIFDNHGASGIYQGLPRVRKSYPSALLAIINRDRYPQ